MYNKALFLYHIHVAHLQLMVIYQKESSSPKSSTKAEILSHDLYGSNYCLFNLVSIENIKCSLKNDQYFEIIESSSKKDSVASSLLKH